VWVGMSLRRGGQQPLVGQKRVEDTARSDMSGVYVVPSGACCCL